MARYFALLKQNSKRVETCLQKELKIKEMLEIDKKVFKRKKN